MSALPRYSTGDKEGLKITYREEKKMLKREHEQVEKEFHRAMNLMQLEQVNDLAEEEETMATKVRLETFDRPKASRGQRRALLNMALRILTPPKTPKLNLEDVESVQDTTLLPVAPLIVDRRAGLTKSLSCTFEAEALAGWKTVVFREGPIGIKLEATKNHKAARVIGFQDTDGVPSQARACGQIVVDDVIVKIGLQVPSSFDHTLELLQVKGDRVVTFRPSFSYEVDMMKRRSGRKKKSKSKRSLLVDYDDEVDEEPELILNTRQSKGNSLIVNGVDDDKSDEKTDDRSSKRSSTHKKTSKNNDIKKTEEAGTEEPLSSLTEKSDETTNDIKKNDRAIQIMAFKPHAIRKQEDKLSSSSFSKNQ